MTKVILGPVRFSFLNVFEPYDRNQDGNPKYSATILLPKDNEEEYAKLRNAMNKAAQEAKDKKFGGKIPPKLNNPVHDGDGTRENGEEFGEECKGHWVFTASTNVKNPPEVVAGRDRHPAEPGEVKSGDYGYVSINLSGYNYNGKKGVGAYLNNVWKTKDGEALGGGRTSAKDDFKDLIKDLDSIDFGDDDPFDGLYEDDDIPF